MKEKALFEIVESKQLPLGNALLKLRPCNGLLPDIEGGQFVNIMVPDTPGAFLRRPISVCNVSDGLLWLYIKGAGKGTKHLCAMQTGEKLDIVLPLGNGFSEPENKEDDILLIGGGVGIAPLLYWGSILKNKGYKPRFLLGGATADNLQLLDEFASMGEVFLTTDDGSQGVRGTVMAHPVLESSADKIYCCGPTPMMNAVARFAAEHSIDCEVSLENRMACGIGACLCCVEDTADGHKCVCSWGPVFNVKELKWV